MYLGIDIGTSSVKTVLFDRDQRLIAQASQPLTVQRPHARQPRVLTRDIMVKYLISNTSV